MNVGKKLILNSIFYTIGEVIPKVLSFFLLPVLTKYLPPSEYGIINYTNTVMLFFFVLSSLSLNTYVLRNYYKLTDDTDRKMMIGNIFNFTLIVNLFISLLLLVIFPFYIRKASLNIPFYPFFLLAIINNFLEGLSIIPLLIYRLKEQAKIFVLLNVGRTFFQFIATFIMLSYLHYGVLSIYLSRIGINVVFSGIYFYVIYRNGIFNLNLKQIKGALKFSLPLLPGVLSYIFISSFDRVVLERYVSLEELGIYSTAATIAFTLNIVVQGLYRTFEQRIFKEHGTPAYKEKVTFLYKIFLFAVFLSAAGISLFSREIFHYLTSQKYMAAAYLVPFLVLPAIVSGLNTFLSTLIIAEGKQVVVTKGTFISALFTLIGDLILIRIYGVPGAIATSILSFAVVYFYYHFHVELNNRLFLPQLFFLVIIIVIPFLSFFSHLTLPVIIFTKLLLLGLYLILFLKAVKIPIPKSLIPK